MTKQTIKNYDRLKHKIRENWEDTQYLIALHNRLLEQIKTLEAKVDRLWASLTSVYEDET